MPKKKKAGVYRSAEQPKPPTKKKGGSSSKPSTKKPTISAVVYPPIPSGPTDDDIKKALNKLFATKPTDVFGPGITTLILTFQKQAG